MPLSFGTAFPAHSATGALVGRMDWAATPLGPTAQWPESLRSALSLCIDSPVIAAVYWGQDFTLLYGDAYLQVVGSKHPWSFGRSAREVWAEIWPLIGPQLQQVMDTGQGFTTSSQRLDMLNNGVLQERYFSYSFTPLRGDAGEVLGVLNQAMETTAQVMAERLRGVAQQALDQETALAAQTRSLLQVLTDGTPDVVYVKDTAGRMVHVNHTVCRMFDLPRADILGRSDADFLPPAQAAAVMANDRMVMASGRTHALEETVQIAGPDGPVSRLYLSTKSPWLAADGTVLGMFGISRDITERKAQENQLRDLNETLEARVAERTLERDRIWRVSREIFVVAGADGRYVAVNPAFERVLGWTTAEATRQPFMAMVHPDDVAATTREFAALLEGVTTLGFECRFRHRDGSYRWLYWTAVPEGELVYAVARDVTELHAQAETLGRAEEQLRQAQKMEAVGQLTGGIAHDFNNLLATIMGSLELLERRADAAQQPDLLRYAGNARHAAQRAAALTHRLLAFSRRQSLDPQPLDVNALVEGMEELMHRTLGENVLLQTALARDLPEAFTDANQLENALLNLAINARDAMPAGGKLTIETSLAQLDARYAASHPDVTPGDYLQLSVSDTGSGMTAEVIAKAFDPFFTTKPIGQGTGLGLSMIYGYVKQSGGHVAIYSEPGMGTSVKLYLPAHQQRARPAAPEAAAATPLGAGESVLLVEDEAGVRMVVMDVLAELGYVAHEAHDAPSALKLIDAGIPIDLLVTDVGLPVTNGRQLAEMARARRPGLKVLFITGYAGQAAVRGEFLDAGMDMLAKPFVIDELAQKIEDMLRQER